MNKRNLAIAMAIAFVAGAAAAGAVIYLTDEDDNGTATGTAATVDTVNQGDTDDDNGQVACTQEAKQCPDGSFVGRTGPDCEFAPCPELPPVQQAENIKVYGPTQGAAISSPVTITGEARVFESTLNYRILDDNGVVLGEGIAMAESPEIGQFGPYSVDAQFETPQTGVGRIEVFNLSARDGSEENLVTILVQFG